MNLHHCDIRPKKGLYPANLRETELNRRLDIDLSNKMECYRIAYSVKTMGYDELMMNDRFAKQYRVIHLDVEWVGLT